MNLMTLVLTAELLLSACAVPMGLPARNTGSAPVVTQPDDKVYVFRDENACVTGGDQELSLKTAPRCILEQTCYEEESL